MNQDILLYEAREEADKELLRQGVIEEIRKLPVKFQDQLEARTIESDDVLRVVVTLTRNLRPWPALERLLVAVFPQ